MIWNLFKKKQEPAAVPAGAAKPTQKNTKETIEERIEREIDSLPSMLKGKLKDPEIKKLLPRPAVRKRRTPAVPAK